MRNNKTRLAGLAVAFFVLLTGLAFSTGGSAQATVSPEQQEEVCYEQVSYQEYQFRKTVTTPAVEEVSHVEYKWDIETRTEIKQPQINKETQTRTATSTNGGRTWSEWSSWSAWADWPGAGPVWDDGRARGPAPHGSGFYDNSGNNREKWERQYR
ncbi:MAG: hypothetical protein NWS14_02570, partial [Pontimonas sp.]|nr:hypothetical protein [Pontimonas sp.]